jgi:hypothetical protein
MATENPKVSAYVPQVLKDKLAEFREKRGSISESQAVIIVLAEYFGIEQVLDRASEGVVVGGVTLARIETIESQLTELRLLVDKLVTENLKEDDKSRLPSDLLGGIEESKGLEQINPASSPLSESLNFQVEETSQQQEDRQQLDLFSSSSSELLSEPSYEIKPISGKKLSRLRFRLGESTVAGAKKSKSLEDFTKWTCEKDPENIAWKFVETPSVGYLPAYELSSELRDRLLAWIKENDLS